MKKVIKISALMLMLVATLSLVSCGKKKASTPEVQEVVDILYKTYDYAKDKDKNGALAEINKLKKFDSSEIKMTKQDAEALYEAVAKFAKLDGKKPSDTEKKQFIEGCTGTSLGTFVYELRMGVLMSVYGDY